MRTFPFSAVVGADDMALALLLTAISPYVGGVLVRGEKGTAKSTMVRALAAILPDQQVVPGCRFGCDPAVPDPDCPDGPHPPHDLPNGDTAGVSQAADSADAATRPARLVELPIGATEDRIMGSLDLGKALGTGVAAYDPGLLATAHRGILYVDEVNLLHDHLVDLLLDAAAMGRATVERDGVSVSHAARIVLVGTMNPEEGELRPQLLDRFGLTVEVSAPKDPHLRAEVVRRRIAFDADPDAFAQRFEADQSGLTSRIGAARTRLPRVVLPDRILVTIAEVCAAFEVDGMRADIVTARAAAAHAAWHGREVVSKTDVRAAARLALPHRRRRNPFDAPGLDEDLLDELLGPDDPDPEPPPEGDRPEPLEEDPVDSADDSDRVPEFPPASPPSPGEAGSRADSPPTEPGPSSRPQDADRDPPARDDQPQAAVAPAVASVGEVFRTRLLQVRGTGTGDPGRRSRARTTSGRTVGADPFGLDLAAHPGSVHLPATIRAAAPHQPGRGRVTGRLLVEPSDLRRTVTEGQETNLVLLCVDASGSMAARRRMVAVKTAVLSLLMDAYQRRDKVGLVTFRGAGAVLDLPPTSSVEVAARRLTQLPHGGRTPLAEGLTLAAETLARERVRDPRRRPLLVLVTDGHATAGTDALARAESAAAHLRATGVDTVLLDCEAGRVRLGLARRLAAVLGAQHLPVGDIGAGALVGAVRDRTGRRGPDRDPGATAAGPAATGARARCTPGRGTGGTTTTPIHDDEGAVA